MDVAAVWRVPVLFAESCLLATICQTTSSVAVHCLTFFSESLAFSAFQLASGPPSQSSWPLLRAHSYCCKAYGEASRTGCEAELTLRPLEKPSGLAVKLNQPQGLRRGQLDWLSG
eukprot:1159445-Pelagomonas_calceolata.AAC.7